MVGKVRLERRLRLRDLAKRICAYPRSAAGNKAALIQATRRYVKSEYGDLTEEEALRRLYEDSGEIGHLVRAAVKQLDDQEYSPATGAQYPRTRRFFGDDDGGDDALDRDRDLLDEDDNDDDADIEKAHPKTKEFPMSIPEHLDGIMKRFGPVQFTKHICDTEKAPCTEAELVAALTKAASEQFNMPGDRAFAKLAEADASVLRSCAIAKAAEFAVFDIKPVVVGTPDAMHEANDDTEQSAALRAYEEILRIGRERFPFLPADQQFARVFEDSKYAALAAQAHRRPGPTTIYAMPGSAAPGRGAYTKSDPAPNADSAYGELMLKAQAYRDAHPELTEAQCFERVYTDRANRELAKRERIESAPR